MAQIPEYTNKDVTLQPSEIGVEAHAAAGRRIGPFYHQAGEELGGAIAAAGHQALDFLGRREINHGAVGLANVTMEASKQWKNITDNADPNDPTLAAGFHAQMEGVYDQYMDGFVTDRGRAWAEEHVDQLRNHLQAKTTADMSTLAHQAAVVNVAATGNKLSSAVYEDPTSLDYARGVIDSQFKTLADNPNLTPDAASKLKTEEAFKQKKRVTMSAIMSMIERNPEAGLAAASKAENAPYVDAAEIQRFERYSRSMSIAARRDALDLKRAQADADRQAGFDKMQDYVQQWYNKDTGDKLRVPGMEQKIMSDPVLRKAHLTDTALREYRYRDGEKPTQIYQENSNQLFGRLILPPGDANKITTTKEIDEALRDGEIDIPRHTFLVNELTRHRSEDGQRFDKRLGDFTGNMRHLIDKSVFGTPDPEGARSYDQYRQAVSQKADEIERAGGNRWDVFNPKSPSYMGSDEQLKNYQHSMQDNIIYQQKRMIQGIQGESRNFGGTVTGAQVLDVPPDVRTPEEFEAWKKANKIVPGTKIRDQNGVSRTVQ